MKILGIIPARGGSKGLPGKNIRKLGGKPLIQYTIESARESKLLTRVILSSDDPEIIKTCQHLGLEVPFIRPEELSNDTASSLEVVLHALNFFLNKGELFDAVCLLQPTAPFRRKGLIDEAVRKFINGQYDALVSVRKVPEDYNPHWVFEERDGKLIISTGDHSIISRRQDLPQAYHRDGALYLTQTQVLLEKKSLYGERLGYIETSEDPYINIDSSSDLARAEKMLG